MCRCNEAFPEKCDDRNYAQAESRFPRGQVVNREVASPSNPTIIDGLEALGTVLGDLHEIINALEARLRPILRPEDQLLGEASPSPTVSQVGYTIWDKTGTAHYAIERLRQLYRLVELP